MSTINSLRSNIIDLTNLNTYSLTDLQLALVDGQDFSELFNHDGQLLFDLLANPSTNLIYILRYLASCDRFHSPNCPITLWACKKQKYELLDVLLDLEPNVDLLDNRGNSALILAKDHVPALKSLLQAGADDRIKNKSKLSLVDVINMETHPEIQTLIDTYCNSDLDNEHISYCISNGYYRAVRRYLHKIDFMSLDLQATITNCVTNHHPRTLEVIFLGLTKYYCPETQDLNVYKDIIRTQLFLARDQQSYGCFKILLQIYLDKFEAAELCDLWTFGSKIITDYLIVHHLLTAGIPVNIAIDDSIIHQQIQDQQLKNKFQTKVWTYEFLASTGQKSDITTLTTGYLAAINQDKAGMARKISSLGLSNFTFTLTNNRITVLTNNETRKCIPNCSPDFCLGYILINNLICVEGTGDETVTLNSHTLRINGQDINAWACPNKYLGQICCRSRIKKTIVKANQYIKLFHADKRTLMVVRLPTVRNRYRMYFPEDKDQFLAGVIAAAGSRPYKHYLPYGLN